MAYISDSEFTIAFKQTCGNQDRDQKIDPDWSTPTRTTNIAGVTGTLDLGPDSDDSDSDTDSFDEDIARFYAGPRARCICCGQDAFRTPPRPITIPLPPPVPSAAQVAESHVTATLRPISALGRDTTLLVLTLNMRPAVGCRFINTVITWSFLPLDSASTTPRVLGLAPQHSVGRGHPRRGTRTEEMGEMRIEGSVRGGASRCVWTVEENASSRHGIPARLQLVAALVHAGAEEVSLELNVRGELGCVGRSVPVEGAVVRVVNVGAAAGASEVGCVEWKGFLKGVTGQVDASVGEA
ncbi:hypothetical protein BD779DRAFT_1470604 [Infundibulicybe gibba]|nr:hypothetical protein BD779DRAFT_1470604 [Infundibulicybe gibba]